MKIHDIVVIDFNIDKAVDVFCNEVLQITMSGDLVELPHQRAVRSLAM